MPNNLLLLDEINAAGQANAVNPVYQNANQAALGQQYKAQQASNQNYAQNNQQSNQQNTAQLPSQYAPKIKYAQEGNPTLPMPSYAPPRSQTLPPPSAPTPTNPMVEISAQGGNTTSQYSTPSYTPQYSPNYSDISINSQPSQSSQYSKQSNSGFSIEDYINMSPEEQLQAQGDAFQQQGKMQMDQLGKLYDAQGNILVQKQKEAFDEYNKQKAALEGEDKTALDKFKADSDAQVKTATENIQEAGQQSLADAGTSLSFQGFGRSTKAADIKSRISRDTQAQIADINRQAGRAVNEYQASLLDKTNQRLQKYQDRLDRYGDAKSEMELQKVKAQSDLMMDLFKQNPMNPQNMIATAEKIKAQRIEQQKLDLEEKKELMKSTRENFTYMINTFGSGYLQNLDEESLQNLASNIGVPASALRSVGPTIKEQEQEWEKLKYASEYSFKNKEFEYGIEKDTRNFAYNAMNDERNFGYKVEADQAQREFQLLLNDRNFQQDLEKIGINFDYDTKKLWMGQQFKDMESQRKYANVGYGSFSAQAQSAAPNGSALFFDAPQKHPATGSQVIAMNPKLVNAYPAGYKKAPGANGLGGQCAYEARFMANVEPLGNSPASKLAKLKQYISKGQGFMRGQGQPQPGDVLISNLSKQYGHAAVVNAVTADGKIILSEFNVKPLSFTNNRTISADSPEVVGFIRAGVKPQYQVKAQDQKAMKANDAAANNLKQTMQGLDPNSPVGQLYAKLYQKISGAPLAEAMKNGSNFGTSSAVLSQVYNNLDPNSPQAKQLKPIIDKLNANRYASDINQQFQSVNPNLPSANSSAQQLANFVRSSGAENLQQYDWWNKNPNKQAAWQMLQGGGQEQPNFGDFGQSQMPNYNADEYGQMITPDRQSLRSGNMPDFMVKQMYEQLNEGYNATGNPQLKMALNQFMGDYQVGQGNKNKQPKLRGLTDSALQNLVKYQGIENTVGQLEQIMGSIDFNPTTGWARENNPWDQQAQQFRAVKQALISPAARTLMMEVGALTASDLQNIEKLVPTMGDTKETAYFKLNQIKNMLNKGKSNLVNTYQMAGYDVGNFGNFSQPNMNSPNNDPLDLGFSMVGGGNSDPLGLGL